MEMALTADQLNPTDEAILDHLHEGRCTIAYIAHETGSTRGNVGNRMRSLVRHGHVKKIHQGLYELVSDPREEHGYRLLGGLRMTDTEHSKGNGERLDLMVEGESKDLSVQENPYVDGKVEACPMHRRALHIADVNGHIVRRTITVGKDELLCLNHRGSLSVAGVEYMVVKSAGDYHCSCGEHFDGPEEAHEHLRSVDKDTEHSEGDDD